MSCRVEKVGEHAMVPGCTTLPEQVYTRIYLIEICVCVFFLIFFNFFWFLWYLKQRILGCVLLRSLKRV